MRLLTLSVYFLFFFNRGGCKTRGRLLMRHVLACNATYHLESIWLKRESWLVHVQICILENFLGDCPLQFFMVSAVAGSSFNWCVSQQLRSWRLQLAFVSQSLKLHRFCFVLIFTPFHLEESWFLFQLSFRKRSNWHFRFNYITRFYLEKFDKLGGWGS